MKLYTVVSPSHEPLYNHYFYPTAKDEFELYAVDFAQHAGGIEYGEEAFMYSVYLGNKVMYEAMCENPGEIIVWSDCDVCFVRPLKDVIEEKMRGFNLLASVGPAGNICLGFFAVRSTELTRHLFKFVVEYPDRDKLHDEDILKKMTNQFTWAPLVSPDFWWMDWLQRDRRRAAWANKYTPGLPSDVRAVHANGGDMEFKRRMLRTAMEMRDADV